MSRDRAFLVIAKRKNYEKRSQEDYLDELSELTRSAGGLISGHAIATVEKPTSNFFISEGKKQFITGFTMREDEPQFHQKNGYGDPDQ